MKLNKNYDVAIIGGGIGGIMTAYRLVEKNPDLSVVIFEKGHNIEKRICPIVKKTVDKVSSSVPGNHIPKTPAKIRQYVQSSQRKVTKLVMGYVDKYVKL